MKLFTSSQIREWDRSTIQRYYEHSSDLMEAAAFACVEYLEEHEFAQHYHILCGTGNNGGDGLAIGRLLNERGREVSISIVGNSDTGSPDFLKNLRTILQTDIKLKFLSESDHGLNTDAGALILDCIFGIGLTRPLSGWIAGVVEEINASDARRISIDVPSGLMPDFIGEQVGAIVHAHMTLTIHQPKRAMLFKENYQFVGDFKVLPLSMDLQYENTESCDLEYYDDGNALLDFVRRKKFDYKHVHGHLQMIGGSAGCMGAAVLSVRAALRAGAGLVTALVPADGIGIVQTAVPEAMCSTGEGVKTLSGVADLEGYDKTAIGPGIGTSVETTLFLRKILKVSKGPLVIDADALNIIAAKNLFRDIPGGSILTPHVGEFDRLFGVHTNSFQRYETIRQRAEELNVVIVLKGPHSMVAAPDGTLSFNSNGNPGMATAGSGDVLTGIIAALFVQGYTASVAARLGVYMHGLAGDLAAERLGQTSMIAGDIVEFLPEAFLVLEEAKAITGS